MTMMSAAKSSLRKFRLWPNRPPSFASSTAPPCRCGQVDRREVKREQISSPGHHSLTGMQRNLSCDDFPPSAPAGQVGPKTLGIDVK